MIAAARAKELEVTGITKRVALDSCRGCGQGDRETSVYRCTWPDGRITFERHCDMCWMLWRRRLEAWGASVARIELRL
ncbi:MAG TPA: hypothetical protein VH277_12545 [Gemmatimonadaceae bacterium]|jgi:hypothetical protein|nr:hypothetical protein [Gemmatimonadaceae bacterium]